MKSSKSSLCLIAVFVVSVSICMLSFLKNNVWYVKVGDYSITRPQYDMWERIIIYDTLDEYADTDLKIKTDNEMADGYTWDEYFKSKTDMEIFTSLSVLNEIGGIPDEDNGYLDAVEDAASASGMDFLQYIRYMYSDSISDKKAKEVLKIRSATSSWLSEVSRGMVTEEDFASYYNEHMEDLDIAYAYVINMENTEENRLYLEDISNDIKNTEQFIAAANEIQGNNGYTEYITSSSCPDSFAGWLFSADNGDMNVSASMDGVYLVMKEHQEPYDAPSVNACLIKFSGGSQEDNAEAAQTFLSGYDKSDGSMQSFLSMIRDNTGGNGYVEGIVQSQVNAGMESWLFDSSRKHGDTTILADGDDMYVFFWDGYGMESWKAICLDEICSIKYEDVSKKIRDGRVMLHR